MINEQLNDPEKCTSDETIAAIISLANFEVSGSYLLEELITKNIQCIVGNMSSLKYHVTGLLELSARRGGLDHLVMNGLLRKLILMYDYLLVLPILCKRMLTIQLRLVPRNILCRR